MNLLQAVILGIIEGVTEFLPISSTGHLILAGHILGLSQTEFLKTFEIFIQFGAILSVVVLYWRSLLVDFEILKRVLVAFVPTAVVGLLFYKVIKHFLMESNQVVLWSMLIGGICLIIFEFVHKEKDNAHEELGTISYGTSLLIGLFQSIAMIPGVSRSAATIIGGLILGLRRKTIVEFSFLLAVPTMLAATSLDLLKNIHAFSVAQVNILLVGFITSFVSALLGVKFLITFIKRHSFVSFGIYRIIVALLFWLFAVTP